LFLGVSSDVERFLYSDYEDAIAVRIIRFEQREKLEELMLVSTTVFG
jgi:hypothetical protein